MFCFSQLLNYDAAPFLAPSVPCITCSPRTLISYVSNKSRAKEVDVEKWDLAVVRKMQRRGLERISKVGKKEIRSYYKNLEGEEGAMIGMIYLPLLEYYYFGTFLQSDGKRDTRRGKEMEIENPRIVRTGFDG